MSKAETKFTKTKTTLASSSRSYSRSRDRNKRHQNGRCRDILDALERLIPLWTGQADLSSLKQRANILDKIRQALRRERVKGLKGHWSYDLARHSQLLKLFHDIKKLPPIPDATPQTLNSKEDMKK